jgi:hypothetical protein
VVEHLSSKFKALSSIPSTAKIKKKEEEEEEREMIIWGNKILIDFF